MIKDDSQNFDFGRSDIYWYKFWEKIVKFWKWEIKIHVRFQVKIPNKKLMLIVEFKKSFYTIYINLRINQHIAGRKPRNYDYLQKEYRWERVRLKLKF